MPDRAGTTKYRWWDCHYTLNRSLSLMKPRDGQCVYKILCWPTPWSMVFHLLKATLQQKSYDMDMLGFNMLFSASPIDFNRAVTTKARLSGMTILCSCSLVLNVSMLQHTWFRWIGQTSADDELIIWISCVGAGKYLKHTGQGDPKNRIAFIHVHHYLSCGKLHVEPVTLTMARCHSGIFIRPCLWATRALTLAHPSKSAVTNHICAAI